MKATLTAYGVHVIRDDGSSGLIAAEGFTEVYLSREIADKTAYSIANTQPSWLVDVVELAIEYEKPKRGFSLFDAIERNT